MRPFQFHLIVLVVGAALSAACGAASAETTVRAGTGAQTARPAISPALRALVERGLRAPDDAATIEALRREGPAGLHALLSEAEASGRLGPALDPLFDRVAAQRYARYSGLYWYTDLDRARERARAENKPVLSLRLLGDLREELSCANSRYFRVVLYPDPAVSVLLRERFVLHWSSERPAPKITVDYGDGRKLVRTVTGNSVHYVLDASGRVLDALPGLWAPSAFSDELGRSLALARQLSEVSDAEFARALRVRHGRDEMTLLGTWKTELDALGVPLDGSDPAALRAQNRRFAELVQDSNQPRTVAATVAAPTAPTKMLSEARLLPTVAPLPTFSANDIERKSSREVWQRIAARHRAQVKLSPESLALVRELAPRGFDLEGHAVPLDEPGFRSLIDGFEQSLSLDTVRNRLDLHRRIHERLGARPRDGLAELNAWLYASVFLTPRSDPWLGLTSDDAFTALPADGIVGVR